MLAALHAGSLGLVDLDAPPAVLLKTVDAAFSQVFLSVPGVVLPHATALYSCFSPLL